MNAFEFNRLLKSNDKEERDVLCQYCLNKIRNRVKFRVEAQDVEQVSHDIAEKFLQYAKPCVISPDAYLNKSVNNYLATYYSKKVKTLKLNDNYGYEVVYPQLEYDDVMNLLTKHVGEVNALLIYMRVVQKYKNTEIAEITGMKYDNVRAHISRSLRKLKKLYKNSDLFVTKD